MARAFYRGYGVHNNDIIEKAITYAKSVVLQYHDLKSYGYSPQIRAYVDVDRAKIHKEMNDSLAFVMDKSNIPKDVDLEFYNFINDTIMSAVVLFDTYLTEHSGELESEELEIEVERIKRMIYEFPPNPDSDYKKYIRLYEEIVNIQKLKDEEKEEEG